jgi:carotenoid phi-ring synthase / carotenoid chi-ring synthase
MSEPPRVTIAGGGLAGLTAALRLAERGYRVKLYEQKPMLGGNLASRPAANGVHLDVYPHMYLGWYHNFWRLLADAGQSDRTKLFRPFSSIMQLRPGEYPTFAALNDPYSASHALPNLLSGVGPPADMFLFGYACIDLLAEGLQPTRLLDNVSVNGFLHARPYMTERAAAAFDNFITNVWAIPSYLASAEDFRAYLAYCFAQPGPAFWLPRGSALDQVIAPLARAVEKKGVEIVRSVQLTSVSCTAGRVSEIGLQKVRRKPKSSAWLGTGATWSEEVDELILAVPAEALSRLVRAGKPGRPIVEAAPALAQVSRLHAQQIPILHLYLTRKLADIPPEPVGLSDSPLALAFTDISETWEGVADFANRTVLALSASDPYGLPGTSRQDDAHAMLVELADYVDFDPGSSWGASRDVDWQRTRYEPNADAQLFINETGTDVWRPGAACQGISNLCLAGDFCANRIGMTTIESAVTTGLEATRVIVERRGGAAVQITEPASHPSARAAWFRYVWAPYAAAAKAWSWSSDCVMGIPRASEALRDLLTPAGAPPGQRRAS